MVDSECHGFSNANFPMDDQGRTYHVGTRMGEVANRIICVGDVERANQLGDMLDKVDHQGNCMPLFRYTSKRQFTTITGAFHGVPVSIVAIGMGAPMMDFFVREVRAVVEGPIAIIRFGSCGSIGDAKLGQIAVASKGSVYIQRQVDYFLGREAHPYKLSQICPADDSLSNALVSCLSRQLGPQHVCSVLNVTADSFYSSQGRADSHFIDDNQHVISFIKQTYPDAGTLEMETYMVSRLDLILILQLFHLSKCAHIKDSSASPIYATACAMIFAERVSNSFISPDLVVHLQSKGGLSCLEAITSFQFQ